ncbi:ABC transporter ATP-binding protein [Halioxenophilus sp. WMMB6]|uniref:ABC transporter ATP-binding protein n=1 Tax=Halioxenophilus sp. WMMB6 TaxID=3073815 RepID=UPI00295F0B0B|nr:ABC transporter ATP-binding protein [Halioxenophilus sp. WMMB6]
MTVILEVRNLRKHYKNVEAVKGISFAIEQGICFGLLGPNGAGKTTTIEMMEGITQPTSGEILYKGISNNPNFKAEAGIQFQSTALMDFLTVIEVLRLFAGLYHNSVELEALIQQCSLGDFLHHPAAKLSGGQRQRLLLALALINNPEIVFLDEPTTGLDPQSRRNFWSLIQSIKAQGKTIVLTTHYMDEAESLCDNLLIVDRGEVVTEGSPQALLKQHFGYAYVCLPQESLSAEALVQFDYTIHAGKIEITSYSIEQTLQQLLASNADLSSLQVRNPTLDDLFLKITGHSLRE